MILFAADWIMLEYRGGEVYQSHCNGEAKRALIMITCDPNIDDVSSRFYVSLLFLCPASNSSAVSLQ